MSHYQDHYMGGLLCVYLFQSFFFFWGVGLIVLLLVLNKIIIN